MDAKTNKMAATDRKWMLSKQNGGHRPEMDAKTNKMAALVGKRRPEMTGRAGKIASKGSAILKWP